MNAPPVKLDRKDFIPNVETRWCPGCGDYSILNTIQKVFPDLGIPKEQFMVVSGIGCSSRFPYYMNTYGFHTLHGRAPTIATGIKASNPDLSVWMVTGDGDGLSIGGNHLMHALRRNPDINIMLFNNRIYGLTKGQYSPTSESGTVTKSSPYGSVETPINPISFALAAGATFIARTLDNNPKHMASVFKAAAEHKGTSFIEIYQNCVIFNDKTFDPIYSRENRDNQVIFLEEGKPLTFGKEEDKGIIWEGTKAKIVDKNDSLPVHHLDGDKTYANMLAQLTHPEFPTPVGVLYKKEGQPTFEADVHHQIALAKSKQGEGDLTKLLEGSDHWIVEDDGETKAEFTAEKASTPMKTRRDQSESSKLEADDPLHAVFQTRIEALLEDYGLLEAPIVEADADLSEAIKLCKKHKIGSLVVVKNGELCGILTDRDLMFRGLGEDLALKSIKVSDVMTTDPVSVPSYFTIPQTLHILGSNSFRHLPVTREGGKVGLIAVNGVISYLNSKVINS